MTTFGGVGFAVVLGVGIAVDGSTSGADVAGELEVTGGTVTTGELDAGADDGSGAAAELVVTATGAAVVLAVEALPVHAASKAAARTAPTAALMGNPRIKGPPALGVTNLLDWRVDGWEGTQVAFYLLVTSSVSSQVTDGDVERESPRMPGSGAVWNRLFG